jgi:ribosomal protein L32
MQYVDECSAQAPVREWDCRKELLGIIDTLESALTEANDKLAGKVTKCPACGETCMAAGVTQECLDFARERTASLQAALTSERERREAAEKVVDILAHKASVLDELLSDARGQRKYRTSEQLKDAALTEAERNEKS